MLTVSGNSLALHPLLPPARSAASKYLISCSANFWSRVCSHLGKCTWIMEAAWSEAGARLLYSVLCWGPIRLPPPLPKSLGELMRRRLTVLTLLPTGCQAVTGRRIKWRVKERGGVFYSLSQPCENLISFCFHVAYKWIKPISESGLASRLTRIDCLFHFQCLASANVLHTKEPSSALLTGREKCIGNKYSSCENGCGWMQRHTPCRWVCNTVRHTCMWTHRKQHRLCVRNKKIHLVAYSTVQILTPTPNAQAQLILYRIARRIQHRFPLLHSWVIWTDFKLMFKCKKYFLIWHIIWSVRHKS